MKHFKDTKDAINSRMSLYNTSTNVSLAGVKPLRRRFLADESILPSLSTDSHNVTACERLKVGEQGDLIDSKGRKVTLKGINMDGAAKLPATPYMPSYKGDSSKGDDVFFDGDNVSFVGRPFPIEEAHQHFLRIKSWGYNTIRYIITWEALEHKGPGIYDDEFISYTNKILDIIHEIGGLYVFIDVHQDVWSRYSGGSGAPMWTFYAAGLQPKRFTHTEAALLHNEPRFQELGDPDCFPKMIWPTNYNRLASLVMFTLFFSGKNYFPQLKLNDQNIQLYLQTCFFKAIKYFWIKVNKRNKSMIDDGTLFGFETLNEPNCGLMGHDHLGYIPSCQQLRVGSTPTVFQCFKLGMGLPCEVEDYRITLAGPLKYATQIVDPKGARAWMTIEEAAEIDAHYGWVRSSEWNIGECIFQQAGIWLYEKVDWEQLKNQSIEDRLITSEICELIKPNYFNQFSTKHNFKVYSGVKPKKIDIEFFTNNNFVDFLVKYKKVIRSVNPDVFFMLQSPVLEIPPNLKTDPRGIVDEKTIYCPHYYDGMSLMFKTWNSKYNVDTLGIMRGRYVNPVLGIVFTERAIRNCLRKQFNEMKRECEEYLGSIPILMSETGMPFDMDDKRAYGNGKYSSQTLALDALSWALEGLNMSHTYWCYTSINCHKWGDRWNNEDFSFWSADDRNLTFDGKESSVNELVTSTVSLTASLVKGAKRKVPRRGSKTRTKSKSQDDKPPNIEGLSIKEIENKLEQMDMENETSESDDDFDDMQSLKDSSLVCWTADNVAYRHSKKCYPSPDGVRAVGAVIRPYVVACCGNIVATEFDLRTVRFSLTVSIAGNDRWYNTPTIIFMPKWHYPNLNYHDIYLSSGYVRYNEEMEYIEWYHHELDDNEATSEISTLVNETNFRNETIIIKNNSGTLDTLSSEEKQQACNLM